tara:strand:- start:374 stop:754 length:381 start_codon:yes stop_codon:yes gene_type:complete
MKTFNAVISFGDGRPFETTIEAKNGQEAQDAGFRNYPGARIVRILSVLSEQLPPPLPKPAPHPFFQEQAIITSKPKGDGRFTYARDVVIAKAIKLRKGGMSYLKISAELGVSKTTVRKWMFEAKVP